MPVIILPCVSSCLKQRLNAIKSTYTTSVLWKSIWRSISKVHEGDISLAMGVVRMIPVSQTQVTDVHVRRAVSKVYRQGISVRTVSQLIHCWLTVDRCCQCILSFVEEVTEAVPAVKRTELVFQRLKSAWNMFPIEHDLLRRPQAVVVVVSTIDVRFCRTLCSGGLFISVTLA